MSQKYFARYNWFRYENLLNEQADHLNAFMEIHAGAGGMKVKIGLKCFKECIRDGLKVKILILLQETRGDEAGIKSCTIKINKEYSYGWLKKESGFIV